MNKPVIALALVIGASFSANSFARCTEGAKVQVGDVSRDSGYITQTCINGFCPPLESPYSESA